MKNPIVVASGVWSYPENVKEDYSYASIVFLKGITFNFRFGNPEPTLLREGDLFYHSNGLRNVGAFDFFDTFYKLKQDYPKVNFALNIAAETISDYLKIIEKYYYFCHDFELNFSCPNIDHNEKLSIKETVNEIKNQFPETRIFVKISPYDYYNSCKEFYESKGDFITMFNSHKGRYMDSSFKNPFVRDYVGISGKCFLPYTLKAIYEISNEFKGINILALGGVDCAEDVVKCLMCGAELVGVGSYLLKGKSVEKLFNDYNNIVSKEISEET